MNDAAPYRAKLPENAQPNYLKSRASNNGGMIPSLQCNASGEICFNSKYNSNPIDGNVVDSINDPRTSNDERSYSLQTFNVRKKDASIQNRQNSSFNSSTQTTKKLNQHEAKLNKIRESLRNAPYAPKVDLNEEVSLLKPETASISNSQQSVRKSGTKETNATRIPLDMGKTFICKNTNMPHRRISFNTDDEEGHQIEIEICKLPSSEYSNKKRKSLSLVDFSGDPMDALSKYDPQNTKNSGIF